VREYDRPQRAGSLIEHHQEHATHGRTDHRSEAGPPVKATERERRRENQQGAIGRPGSEHLAGQAPEYDLLTESDQRQPERDIEEMKPADRSRIMAENRLRKRGVDHRVQPDWDDARDQNADDP
jgi:hypothetical protein